MHNGQDVGFLPSFIFRYITSANFLMTWCISSTSVIVKNKNAQPVLFSTNPFKKSTTTSSQFERFKISDVNCKTISLNCLASVGQSVDSNGEV